MILLYIHIHEDIYWLLGDIPVYFFSEQLELNIFNVCHMGAKFLQSFIFFQYLFMLWPI